MTIQTTALDHTNDYLLDKRVKIFQPINGYRASTDAVLVSSLVNKSAPARERFHFVWPHVFRLFAHKSPELNCKKNYVFFPTKVPKPTIFPTI